MIFWQGEKYRWQQPEHDGVYTMQLAAKYSLSPAVIQTLLSRGYTDAQAIDNFLQSSYEKDVAHPSLMKDALKAVERLELAMERGEKILVFGDYDVDGITSSSMMMACLLPLGSRINFFLPHRVKDGYGLSVSAVERAAQSGYSLIITVDNGIAAFEAAARARALGIDLVITDHHKPHDHVPDAYAIVNPHQKDCAYPFKVFAGVGVIFKILSLFYERRGLTLPDKVYELLLLGTVADVVPLLGENRFWVRHGLQHVNRRESIAFCVLKKNGNVTKALVSSTDIGFSIAPQINALGRLQDARQGPRFLIGADKQEVEQIGAILLELNQKRRGIEREVVQEILNKIESNVIDLTKDTIVIASSPSWPPGVIGLAASRVVSSYGRPAILFHETKDGLLKGSCRSIPGFDMFAALSSVHHLLERFGGHPMAAGLSLKVENLGALKEHLEARIKELLTPEDLQQKIVLDAELLLADVTKKLVDDMEQLQPFGHGNSEPMFYIKNVSLMQKPTLLKELHVKAMIFADGVIKPIVFFNRPDLFEKLCAQDQELFDVAVKISENHWNGKVSIELLGIDVTKLRG